MDKEPEENKESLPRIRGGVSVGQKERFTTAESSPHTRGCFQLQVRRRRCVRVFPAYAGVFLPVCVMRFGQSGLPRIRGGVSITSPGTGS